MLKKVETESETTLKMVWLSNTFHNLEIFNKSS